MTIIILTMCIQDNLHNYLNTKYIDSYKILNVTPLSSKEEIKKSYIRLSRIYHPDKCKDVHANELFKLIHKAYKELENGDNLLQPLLQHIDKQYVNVYVKMLSNPNELTIKDVITLGYSFYKMC